MSELRNITIGQMLEETAGRFPTRQAVKYIEMEFDKTWYELNNKVDRIARGLLGMGLGKGDHAAVWATNYPQWLVLFFAVAKIGVVLATVNTNYKEHELEYLLKHSDAKALFVCDGLKDIDCEKTIYSICPEILTCEKGDIRSEKLPFLRMVVSFENRYEGMYHWNDIEKFGVLVSDQKFRAVRDSLDPDDVIVMQYTSGTTGFPKGVMLTHNNLVNNGRFTGDGMGFTENDRLCIPVPFFHCFGVTLAILACATHGSAMVPLLFYTPMKVMHAVEYERCTAVHGVPTMFIGILEHRDFEKYDYSSLRTGIMAGATCPAKVMSDVMTKMNMRDIVIVFGQTESSPGCTMTTVGDSAERRVNTVGRAYPFTETKIADPETGCELGPNTPGEFCARGYCVMKGYYKPEEGSLPVIDADGWLHTGDVAEADEHGYYRITGRIKDMIIRGGENISPKEIEDMIYTFDGVKDVAVVAAPSRVYGEEVCAVVVPKDGVTLDPDRIRAHVGNNLAKHKEPKYVVFADELPLTASGKIQKYLLRERVKKIIGMEDSE
ncbi:MAG: AMP-binding protein [Firmicutes bacterium]|nr:AMP-binding protein [Bacillota bacterium]